MSRLEANGRWVDVDGMDNVRDLGGLPLRTGGVTRSGQILRGARLAELTESGTELLAEKYGIRLVIDLRSPREVDRDGPTSLERAGVRTEHLSVLPEGQRPVPREEEDPKLFAYRGYLNHRPENVLAALRLLADPENGPTVVHCAAGKDRTGVICALVEEVAGVERDAVVDDYALSNERLPQILRRLAMVEPGIDVDHPELYLCPPSVMAALMAELDAHGSPATWLKSRGLTDDQLTTLRTRLT